MRLSLLAAQPACFFPRGSGSGSESESGSVATGERRWSGEESPVQSTGAFRFVSFLSGQSTFLLVAAIALEFGTFH